VSFVELGQATNATNAIHLRTLHIEECVEVMMIRGGHAEPLEPRKHCGSNEGGKPPKKSRQVYKACNNYNILFLNTLF